MTVIDRSAQDTDALVASLRDPRLFSDVFDTHFPPLHGYLRRRVGEPLAEEIAAETFARAFDRRASFDPHRSGVRAWLHGIAANLMHDHRRTEARRLRAYARTASRDERRDGADSDAVHGRLAAEERAPALANALRSLRAPEREVLLLTAWADLSYDEIAEAIGVPVGTVRSRLHRARAHIRAELQRQEARHA